MELHLGHLLWITFMVSFSIARLHPSNIHRRFHRKKSNTPKKSSSQSTALLPTMRSAETIGQLNNMNNIETVSSTPSTEITSSSNGITFQVGNHTINNLENTLDDIAPKNSTPITNDIGLSSNPFTDALDTAEAQNTVTDLPKNNNNTSNVILEVINIAPYFKGRSKYSKKFALIVSLYATLAVSCVVLGACLIRGITKRNRRHRQYMLLTKRDLEFPLGGGGI